jgi:catalase
VEGLKQRVRGAKFQEHYNHAQLFYNSLAPHEKVHLVAAISFELSHCDEPEVYKTYTKLLNNIDFDLAKAVAQNIGGVVPEKPARPNHGEKSPSLSQEYFHPKTPTIASRRIAILVADGFNEVEVQAVRTALNNAKATTWIIGPRRGKIDPESQLIGTGEPITADHHFDGQRSTLFDAIFVPSGSEHVKALMKNGRAVHWVKEAFGHCKAIGAIGDGMENAPFACHLY